MTKQKVKCNLSVAIVAKGRVNETWNLLTDLSKQSYMLQELVFVEATKDGKSFSKSLIEKIFSKNKIRVVYKEVGFDNIPKSRNEAIGLANNRYLVFIDNDVRLGADYLKKIVEKIEDKNRNFFALVGEIKPTVSTWLSEYMAFVFSRGFTKYNYDREIDFYPTMAVVLDLLQVRKYALLFDHELKTGEDTDFFLSAFEKGLKIYYCPDLIVWHEFETTNFVSILKKFFVFGKYFELIEKKHLKTFNVPCYFPKKRWEWWLWPLGVIFYCIKIIRYIPARYWPISFMTHLAMIVGVYTSPLGLDKLRRNWKNK